MIINYQPGNESNKKVLEDYGSEEAILNDCIEEAKKAIVFSFLRFVENILRSQ